MLSEIIQIASILVPILLAGFGAYVKIREEITALNERVKKLGDDLDSIAFMVGTKRALAQKKERKPRADS